MVAGCHWRERGPNFVLRLRWWVLDGSRDASKATPAPSHRSHLALAPAQDRPHGLWSGLICYCFAPTSLLASFHLPNIVRLLILNNLASPIPSYLFQLHNTPTLQIISRPKAGDQPPIALPFANPEFNRLAISNKTSSNLRPTLAKDLATAPNLKTFCRAIAVSPTQPHTSTQRHNLCGAVIIRQSGFEDYIKFKHGAE